VRHGAAKDLVNGAATDAADDVWEGGDCKGLQLFRCLVACMRLLSCGSLVRHSTYTPNTPVSGQAGSRVKLNGLTFEQEGLILLSKGQQHNLQGAGLLLKSLHVHTNLLQLSQLPC